MGRRQKRTTTFWEVALAIAAVAVLMTLFFADPATSQIYPPCPWKALFGLTCPGCGSLRAVHHLLHGELRLAAAHNLLLVALLPWSLWLGARRLIARVRGHHQPWDPSRSRWGLVGLVALLLLFGVLRNLDSPRLSWLRPPPVEVTPELPRDSRR